MPCGSKAQRIFSLHHGNPGSRSLERRCILWLCRKKRRRRQGRRDAFLFACAALPSRSYLSLKAALSSPFRGVRRLKDAKKTPSDGGAAGQTVKTLRRVRKGRILSNFQTYPAARTMRGRHFAAKNPISRAKAGEGGTRRGACIPVRQRNKTFFDKRGAAAAERAAHRRCLQSPVNHMILRRRIFERASSGRFRARGLPL